MKVKLWIKLDEPELAKSIDIDNVTAPKNCKIKTYWKNGYMITEIESEDLGSIANVLDEILELVKLARVSKEL
jgi:hypothetical protein